MTRKTTSITLMTAMAALVISTVSLPSFAGAQSSVTGCTGDNAFDPSCWQTFQDPTQTSGSDQTSSYSSDPFYTNSAPTGNAPTYSSTGGVDCTSFANMNLTICQPSNSSSPTTGTASQSSGGSSNGYTALAPLPNCTKTGCSQTVSDTIDFQGYVQNMFYFIIFLASSAAVFMIVLGGLQYMTTDSIQGKTEGRKKALNAVYGLLLVLTSYLIMRTIDPRLVAIPTTLVTPLDINYNKNIFSDWLAQLQQQVSEFKTQDNAAKQAIFDAENQNAQYQNQINSLSNDILQLTGETDTTQACSDFSDYPNVQDDCKQILNIKNKQSTLQASTTSTVLN
ncbi:MAG: hypothetical protein KGI49_03415, partial [Patescibacteria group bacterium]|nr:hypothetical protein [Patescibacteria group bacterium]